MSLFKCAECGVHVEERPLYRQNPKGERPAIMWCEPCIANEGKELERDPIVDLIDADNRTQYVYSHNDEDYVDDYEEARERALDIVILDWPETQEVTIYRAEKQGFTHSDFVCGVSVIEQIQVSADDQGHEYAEDYLQGIGNEAIKELETLITEFLNDRFDQPRFYVAANSESVKEPLTSEEIADIKKLKEG